MSHLPEWPVWFFSNIILKGEGEILWNIFKIEQLSNLKISNTQLLQVLLSQDFSYAAINKYVHEKAERGSPVEIDSFFLFTHQYQGASGDWLQVIELRGGMGRVSMPYQADVIQLEWTWQICPRASVVGKRHGNWARTLLSSIHKFT